MNVVGSSGWLEYFADSERAALFAPAVESPENLIVPVVCIYEVFKKVLRERGKDAALQVASAMQTGRVVNLEIAPASEAAQFRLPFADSIIYAVTLRHQATLWTQDEHFENLAPARFFPKSALP